MKELLETVEISSGDRPEASIVWLHGLGADGNDFAPIVPALDLPCAVRFVFPHAPVRTVTINMGARMRAWYDVVSLQRTDLEDEAGIRDSAAAVARLVERERERGIEAARILLAGFSQGGAIALHLGLRYPERLAGILALSTYLPLAWALREERVAVNDDIPVFMAHGAHDSVVPQSLGSATRAQLQELGYSVEWQSYPMPHSVCPEEIADIGRWLNRVLS